MPQTHYLAHRQAMPTSNAKLLAAMAELPANTPRTARFVCVLAFVRHADDPLPVLCQAVWEGEIAHALSGEGGFGYDPVFMVPGEGMTSAELSRERKAQLSQRGRDRKGKSLNSSPGDFTRMRFFA